MVGRHSRNRSGSNSSSKDIGFDVVEAVHRNCASGRGSSHQKLLLPNQAVGIIFEVCFIVKAVRGLGNLVVGHRYSLTVVAGHDAGPKADMFHKVANLKSLERRFRPGSIIISHCSTMREKQISTCRIRQVRH